MSLAAIDVYFMAFHHQIRKLGYRIGFGNYRRECCFHYQI